MYSGHRNYTSQFRQRPSPHPPPPLPHLPPPPYHQASPGSVHHFLQAAPGPQLPPVPQAPQFFGRLAPPLGQPIPFTHTPSVNSTLPYLQPLPPPPPPLAPPPPPPQVNGNTPTVPSYSLANRPISLPLPPPPPRMLQPAPQLNVQPQGQMSYHSVQPSYSTPHPPPWPTNLPNPPTPPNFEMTVPISFPGQNRATDAHPPAVPSLPPPPPPPPPSSPPPLPPSPPAPIPVSDSFSSDALKVLASDFKVDSETLVVDNASAHLVDVSKAFKEGKEILVDLEASENLSLPPPRPDETVIRSIEVLCQFIVKVGPAFENTARAKEAGNPQFAFLFGGEPGSAAAIGHEYFQWMKKKYVLEAEFHKGLKHNALPSSTLATGVSSQSGNLHCVNLSHSPATSDIDMEDDITPADISKGFNIKNEESTISTHACSSAHENVKEQIHSDLYVGIGASSPIAPVMDAEDEKEFSVFEDVSPERGSPDTGDLDGITYSSSRFPTGDAIKGKVLLNTEDKPQEATGVFLKYGSPFRLIQDYASDESDENVKSGDAEDFHPVSPSARTVVISSLKQEKPSELCPNFDAQDFTAAGNESVYKTTSGQHSPSIQQEVATSTENTIMMTSLSKLTSGQHFPSLPLEKVMSQEKTVISISLSEFNTMNRNKDSDIHQAEKLSEDGRKTLWPTTSKYDDLDERKLATDKKTEFFSGSVMEQQVSLDVDEFGRLIRKGASGSESDGSHYTEKHGKRGRSQNRSLSRSPHGSRKRYRSRSARRRDKRSHSHSWSPKRRSKSPLSFRKNMPARRSRDQPPECFNFNRGRCFYGASCRFLHRDFVQHIHSQQRHQDSRKSRYFDGSDDTSLSRISRRDNTGVEMHIEKNNKFVEPRNHVKHVYQGQSDSKTQTISGQFSEGKDEQAPTSETKATEDQVSQEMINMELEPSGGKGPAKSTLNFVEEGSTQLLLESSEPQQADIFQVYSSDGKDSSFSEFPSSADAISLQPSLSTIANVVEAKTCSQHNLDQVSSVLPLLSVQTNYTANDPIQALNSQINVDESNATEATLNQNIATDSKLHSVTSIKTPVQPLSEGFLPQNLLTPGASFQTPQSLPPAPPHGQHPMHIPNDSLTNAFSTQHFKENAMPPMSSYPSQLPSHMLYPPRPHFSGNLLPNNELQQSNLPLYDQYLPPPQNMNTLLRRPPFPSSDSFQLPHQQNAMPLRNDFIPAVRPYLSGEIPGSRPSDLFCQPFSSSSPGYPPRHRSAGIEQGGFHLPNQGLTPSGSVPLPRSLQGEEISMPHIRNIHHALQPPLYNRQNPLPANLSSKFDATGSMHPSIRRYTESSFQPQPSDTGLLRFPIREYFNPYASTFEQPLRGPDILGTEIRRIDSAPNADITGFEFGMRASSPGTSKRLTEQTLPKTGSFAHEATAEVVPKSQRQLSQAPASGIPYDPLFDSIEPSSDTSKLRAEEQNSGINDTGSASKLNLRRPKAGSKKRRGASAAEVKVEVDELGEVATDADAGGVENESPQLLDKDWSPPNLFDGGDANVGEIEITQVRSPGKSKKSRDSRSMRLFKVAIADFAKEVLKPSWRQGNLSKEAFKTIVKKTVDKVAGALPSHQLPKSQAKINHYMESSQRKLTKLVMGYVDKYVKM